MGRQLRCLSEDQDVLREGKGRAEGQCAESVEGKEKGGHEAEEVLVGWVCRSQTPAAMLEGL